MKTKVFMATVQRMRFVLLPMVGVLLMLLYTFSILGMEFLNDALDEQYSASLGDRCAPSCPSFNTVPLAWLTLFQLVIGTAPPPSSLYSTSCSSRHSY